MRLKTDLLRIINRLFDPLANHGGSHWSGLAQSRYHSRLVFIVARHVEKRVFHSQAVRVYQERGIRDGAVWKPAAEQEGTHAVFQRSERTGVNDGTIGVGRN